MIGSTQNLPEAQDRVHDPAAAPAPAHHAGRLVRLNLPPLMGMRDAALAAVEKLLSCCGELSPQVIFDELGPAIAGMFRDAVDAGNQIIGMFNNPDTIARESRLLNNAGILAEISGALEDFRDLDGRMRAAVGSAAGDREYLARLNRRMTEIGALLTDQLRDAYGHYHDRLIRYQDYAVKNLSPENAERYHLAYDSAAAGYNATIERILKHIPNSKTRSFS